MSQLSVRIVCLVACLVAGNVHGDVHGDEPNADQQSESTDRIALTELSKPPGEIAKLIKQGKVTLFYGRKPWSEMVAARDRVGVYGRGLRLLAETKFEIGYDYRSRSSWRILEGTERKLRISVRYTRADLTHKHKIWFRRRPPTDGFWDDRLVRHEFDHVQISTKTILAEKFLEKLRASSVITETIEQGQRVDDSYVRKRIDMKVKATFDELVDLISIRYKELDRITVHGQRPVPADTTLRSWLDDGFDPAESK